MTFLSPDITGKPFEISNSSERLDRAGTTYWMRTILFGNQQKYNVFALRCVGRAVFVVLCIVLGTVNTFAQEDWTSPLRRCWVFENDDSSRINPASDNDKVFVPTSKGSIIALDQLTGAISWEADLGGNLNTSVMVKEGELFTSAVFGSLTKGGSSAIIRKIDAKTGFPLWQFTLESPSGLESGKTGPDKLIIVDRFGTITSLDAAGKMIWKHEFGTEITTGVVEFDSKLYFGTGNNTVVILDEKDGALLSQVNLKSTPESIAISSTGRFFTGDARGHVFAFGNKGIPGWKAYTGAGISEISLFDGDLIVSSKDNFIYRISVDTGKKIWKRKLAGRILGSVNIDQYHAVFLTSGSTTALIVDLRDGNLVNKFDFEEAFVAGPVSIKDGFAVPTLSTITAITSGKCEIKKDRPSGLFKTSSSSENSRTQ